MTNKSYITQMVGDKQKIKSVPETGSRAAKATAKSSFLLLTFPEGFCLNCTLFFDLEANK